MTPYYQRITRADSRTISVVQRQDHLSYCYGACCCGRTLLAHSSEMAGSLLTDLSLVVLVTNGRANVSLYGGDPWKDALEVAARIVCPAVIVDSFLGDSTGSKELASSMKAQLIRLDDLNQNTFIQVLHS